MKKIFYTAGGVLVLNALVHFARLAVGSWDANASLAMVLTGLFGLAYLVIGVMLFMLRESVVWPGVILSAVGLLLTLIGLEPNPDTYAIAFVVLDLLSLVACTYILFMGRARLHRVS